MFCGRIDMHRDRSPILRIEPHAKNKWINLRGIHAKKKTNLDGRIFSDISGCR